ncbi:alpha/beta hydrolase fold domain-containing protein [Hymenobacter sp. BT770]|uniref:alpha/beta hydrolase fold domain-containing protein n=1 Tax=Hymenobacter sp. BT770 TaxID=2886942 RepID=UPI001D1289B0|nr:alpha/beta hydrolase fold domain-containing protein [Hymenobacter sp. BT770]MCC3154429.1 alpha/beta hydrolase fold domain-containing protein [Hymenobacter sp. BT770]MDO3416300.1 alpha/beta hydrolase fold domain-containing protein [Hymenobacter sp. BT770]
MKSTLLFALLLLLSVWHTASAQTPIDTTGGRYYRPIFPNVTVTSGVAYGSAVTFAGTTQTLLMDIYQPTGDIVAERPVIIFAHQGGFVTGSRTDAYMVKVCTQFAKLGYITASIDYRLGFALTGLRAPADTPQVAKAAIRGMQDLRAAVRFFRKDAVTTNTYRVSPSRIAVGGSSAGAFAALEVGYLDKDSEVPAYVDLAGLGGIEGSSGNPGYSSAVLAVLNLSGATERPSLIEFGNAPLYSMHGTADATVPYLQGTVGSLLPPKYVFGSGRLNPYATTVGVPNRLRTLRGAGHVPFESTTAAGLAYADTAYRDMREFLRPLLVPVTAPSYPSLVISTPTNVAGGSYQDITINSSQAVLLGNITVYGTLVVKSQTGQTPGSLKTNCFVVDGPGSFELQAGATLRICSPEGIAASGATGAIRNTGTRIFSSGAGYAYEGTTDQVTGSGLPAQVRELEIALPAANSVTLTNALSISQRLLPTSGTLNNSTRALTLLSGPAGTALSTPGPGTLTSALTVQRYIDPAVNPGLGYRHLATPVDNVKTVDLATASFTPVLTPAYNTSTRPDLVVPFPNLFDYEQGRVATSPATSYSAFDKGWFVPLDFNNAPAPLVRGQGYAVNLKANQTLAFTGPLSRNNEDIPVSLAAAVSPDAGWHLLGNPFASALNWDNVTVPAGMSSAMYIFVSTKQYEGRYRTYLNGMGGVGSTVPLGQGFFVRSLATAPVTVTFNLRARITDFAGANAATLQRSTADTRPRLRLTLADAATPGSLDETYLYLEAGATAGPDLAYDADKLPNPSGLNLASVAAGHELAINGLPLLTAATVVPLALTAPHTGTYVLAAEDLVNFTPGTALTLTDALTGTRTPLAAGTQYRFTLASLSAPNRFALELRAANVTATTAAQALAAQLQVYPNPASGSFRVQLPLPAGVPVVAAWLTNGLGQTVRSQSLAAPTGQLLNAEVNVLGLAPGVYQLHLRVAGTPLVRRVVVQ